MAALIRREWASVWSSGGAYALRTGYGLALLLTVAYAMLSGFDAIADGDPDAWAAHSAEVFATAATMQLGLVTLLAVVHFPPALLREKEQRTMDLLLLSPLRGAEILLAKTAGALLGFGVLMLTGLPVLLLLLLLGGFSAGELISMHLIAFGSLLGTAALCTFLSAWSTRVTVVTVTAFILTAAFYAAPFAGPVFAPSWAPAWDALTEWNPAVILQREVGGVGAEPASAIVFAAGAVLLLVSCIVAGAALYGRHARSQERRAGWRWLRSVRWSAADLLGVSDPVARRHVARAGRPMFLFCWFGFLMIGTWVIDYLYGQKTNDGVILLFVAAEAGAIAWLSAMGAASDVVDRRRNGSLELLLASNAEPATLVRAALAGGLFRALMLMIVPVLQWLAYSLFFAQSYGINPWLVAAAMVAAAITAACVGTAAGVRCRSQAAAVTAGMLLSPPIIAAVAAAVAFNAATCAVALALWVPAMRWLYAFSAHRLRAGALGR